MAKEYEVKCPYCKFAYVLLISHNLEAVAKTSGMRDVEEEQHKSSSPESLDENNWFDLGDPCPNCHRTFSYNIITGESRE